MVKFQDLNLSQSVIDALDAMSFTKPTPIQIAVVPLALAGKDILGESQTGTGKTAAFGIPLVEAALQGKASLVLVPTRELAQQVTGEVERIGRTGGVRALALYGGASLSEQAKALRRGEHAVLVATPGRLRDHMERGNVDVSQAALVVLDEADEMLKMGFLEEVEEVLAAVGPERQMMLFSATLPDAVTGLAERHMRDPEHVRVRGAEGGVAADRTAQHVVQVTHQDKPDVLVRIFAVERPTGMLVFRHTREGVDELVQTLRRRGLDAEALHGGMVQQSRDQVLDRLRSGKSRVLVATNVAARGLDVDTVSHVVNYDAPRETDAYVHRIGRTGRAGREGRSFLFVTPSDRGRLRGIERAVGGRLAWYEVPSDRQVMAAVGDNLARWLGERAAEATEDELTEALAAVDAAATKGLDLRVLAAVALRAAAKHEGLGAPPLQARSEAPMPRGGAATSGARVPLTINVGRQDGVRPGDLVGALTNEGGLVGADVGRIDILPRMSVVEVPAARAEHLIRTMATSTIRGRGVQMRVADRWDFRGPEGRKPFGKRVPARRRA